MAAPFDQLIDHLRAQHEWRRRLVVRRVAMRDDGSCNVSDSDTQITISVRRGMNWSQTKDTLIHEFAHAEELDRWRPHGAAWGKLHAKYYEAWEAFNG